MTDRASETVELRAEVARLTRMVEDLEVRLEAIDGGSGSGQAGSGRHSRRDLLRVAGAAVAGAAGGVLLNGLPAAASNGGNVVLGNTVGATLNDAANTTSLTATTTAGPTPLVEVIGPGASVPAAPPSGPELKGALQVFAQTGIPANPKAMPPVVARPSEGIDGWAPGGIGVGVLGASDVGYGVLGESGAAIDVAAFGTGRVFQFSITDNTGAPLPGPPAFTPSQPASGLPGGELVRDANSVLWASRATGLLTAGWRRINTTRVDREDGLGPFVPVRIIDTRDGTGLAGSGLSAGQKLQPGTTYTFGPFTGVNGIPSDAVGIIGNVTVAGFTGGGYVTVFPGGVAWPGNSTLNFGGAFANTGWANAFTIGFGTGVNAGKISIRLSANGITSHVIIDVNAFLE